GGVCFVAGLLTDNVITLDSSGNRIPGAVLNLPDGTMPRQVLVRPDDTVLAVWGCGEVTQPGGQVLGDCRGYLQQTSAPSLQVPVSIGIDPTPEIVRKGRQVFFDASHSLHNNTSCASCHDEGKTDMLAWNLSKISASVNDGYDNKGPMVTQTLVGI